MSISSRAATPRGSSPRASTSVPASSRSSVERASTPAITLQRRNRAALLDYYGINSDLENETASDKPEEKGGDQKAASVSVGDHLDQPNFDAERYVKDVLQNEDIESVATIATELVRAIGKLGSERRTLVYNNYSKLIAATDTILKMKTSMEPLTPATSTLAPTLLEISKSASAVAEAMKHDTQGGTNRSKTFAQQTTVRWVLDTPQRLSALLSQSKRKEAEEDWSEIERILDSWSGVKGTDEIKRRCDDIMKQP